MYKKKNQNMISEKSSKSQKGAHTKTFNSDPIYIRYSIITSTKPMNTAFTWKCLSKYHQKAVEMLINERDVEVLQSFAKHFNSFYYDLKQESPEHFKNIFTF